MSCSAVRCPLAPKPICGGCCGAPFVLSVVTVRSLNRSRNRCRRAAMNASSQLMQSIRDCVGIFKTRRQRPSVSLEFCIWTDAVQRCGRSHKNFAIADGWG